MLKLICELAAHVLLEMIFKSLVKKALAKKYNQ
jgi:hypothetical protein